MSADAHEPVPTYADVDAAKGDERKAPAQATGMAEQPSRQLVELTRSECLSLLAATRVGRVVAVSSGDRPMIRPVNYAFDPSSQSVVFRTNVGAKFHAVVRGTRASFEIDEIDATTRSGWSVIVTGVTEEVTQPSEIARLQHLGLEPWAPGSRSRWVRLGTQIVSGRRIMRDTGHAES